MDNFDGKHSSNLTQYNCGQTIGWIKMALGKDAGLGPGHIVLDGDPAPQQPLPTFRPISIVAKRSPISATAELLFWFSIEYLVLMLFADWLGRTSLK